METHTLHVAIDRSKQPDLEISACESGTLLATYQLIHTISYHPINYWTVICMAGVEYCCCCCLEIMIIYYIRIGNRTCSSRSSSSRSSSSSVVEETTTRLFGNKCIPSCRSTLHRHKHGKKKARWFDPERDDGRLVVVSICHHQYSKRNYGLTCVGLRIRIRFPPPSHRLCLCCLLLFCLFGGEGSIPGRILVFLFLRVVTCALPIIASPRLSSRTCLYCETRSPRFLVLSVLVGFVLFRFVLWWME